MKRNIVICCLLAVCLLTGCAKSDAQGQEPVCTTETAAASTLETQPETTVSTTAATIAETTDTTIVTETLASEAETEPPTVSPESLTPETVPESTQAPTPETEPEPVYETFTGILIDTDCSDFDDPPAHDLPCMLMDTCRASGYGLDIQREDGTWYFIPFDENGQNLTWDYLLQITRMDNLYVTVSGTMTDGVIAVQTLEELP